MPGAQRKMETRERGGDFYIKGYITWEDKIIWKIRRYIVEE